MEPTCFTDVSLTLTENSFFLPRHQYIMGAISRLSERNEGIDIITVSDELKVMGYYLCGLFAGDGGRSEHE